MYSIVYTKVVPGFEVEFQSIGANGFVTSGEKNIVLIPADAGMPVKEILEDMSEMASKIPLSDADELFSLFSFLAPSPVVRTSPSFSSSTVEGSSAGAPGADHVFSVVEEGRRSSMISPEAAENLSAAVYISVYSCATISALSAATFSWHGKVRR